MTNQDVHEDHAREVDTIANHVNDYVTPKQAGAVDGHAVNAVAALVAAVGDLSAVTGLDLDAIAEMLDSVSPWTVHGLRSYLFRPYRLPRTVVPPDSATSPID